MSPKHQEEGETHIIPQASTNTTFCNNDGNIGICPDQVYEDEDGEMVPAVRTIDDVLDSLYEGYFKAIHGDMVLFLSDVLPDVYAEIEEVLTSEECMEDDVNPISFVLGHFANNMITSLQNVEEKYRSLPAALVDSSLLKGESKPEDNQHLGKCHSIEVGYWCDWGHRHVLQEPVTKRKSLVNKKISEAKISEAQIQLIVLLECLRLSKLTTTPLPPLPKPTHNRSDSTPTEPTNGTKKKGKKRKSRTEIDDDDEEHDRENVDAEGAVAGPPPSAESVYSDAAEAIMDRLCIWDSVLLLCDETLGDLVKSLSTKAGLKDTTSTKTSTMLSPFLIKTKRVRNHRPINGGFSPVKPRSLALNGSTNSSTAVADTLHSGRGVGRAGRPRFERHNTFGGFDDVGGDAALLKRGGSACDVGVAIDDKKRGNGGGGSAGGAGDLAVRKPRKVPDFLKRMEVQIGTKKRLSDGNGSSSSKAGGAAKRGGIGGKSPRKGKGKESVLAASASASTSGSGVGVAGGGGGNNNNAGGGGVTKPKTNTFELKMRKAEVLMEKRMRPGGNKESLEDVERRERERKARKRLKLEKPPEPVKSAAEIEREKLKKSLELTKRLRGSGTFMGVASSISESLAAGGEKDTTKLAEGKISLSEAHMEILSTPSRHKKSPATTHQNLTLGTPKRLSFAIPQQSAHSTPASRDKKHVNGGGNTVTKTGTPSTARRRQLYHLIPPPSASKVISAFEGVNWDEIGGQVNPLHGGHGRHGTPGSARKRNDLFAAFKSHSPVAGAFDSPIRGPHERPRAKIKIRSARKRNAGLALDVDSLL
ncbi:hypothetical protein HDU76_004166 [Blyttiomyces sp. JEL0837]|nr:hypothetical protein HDU76_004166 [Blyttiomyces sp. JEL0837]